MTDLKKELREEKPDYVADKDLDKSGTGDPNIQPNVGTDPQSLPEEGKKKTIVAPDPNKVVD